METRQPVLPRTKAKPSLSGNRLRMATAWLIHPLQTAAAAPSGRSLARLVAKEIDTETGPILELGAGTGSLTSIVLSQGVTEDQLTLVEKSPHHAQLLRDRFPRARVITADAAGLSQSMFSNTPHFGAAIGGMGLLSMHPRSLRAMLRVTFRFLRPGASLYQCSFGFGRPVSKMLLNRLGLRAEWMGATWMNLPPAAVYRISRPAPAECFSDTATCLSEGRLPSR